MPPVSPDFTIEMYRLLKTWSCFARAPDSDEPCSTSRRASFSTRASSLLSD